MKTFDKPAAMRGARVCTMEGLEARILCFDIKCSDTDKYKPILAEEMLPNGRYSLVFLHDDGRFDIGKSQALDLMMADDNYQEKLARGEYDAPTWQEPHRIMTPEQIASVADESYWRKMYAGMALQGLVASDKWRRMEMGDRVCVCVEMADALIEELKSTKK